jgi:hypothetical protein
MRHAHRAARTALALQADGPGLSWGWRGRTVSGPVIDRGRPLWLRVACAPKGADGGVFWSGAREAQAALTAGIPRPHLHAVHDWTDPAWSYRAELSARAPSALAASSVPGVQTAFAFRPDPRWWADLRSTLGILGRVATDRITIRQSYLDRAMPHFLGEPIGTTVQAWTTAHGDLHAANLAGPALCLLDWEGWGRAPVGYDAATFYAHSLLTPPLAARIRQVFTDELETDTGRFAELVAITELLHTTTRGDNFALASPLRARAEHLLGRRVPEREPNFAQPDGAL